MNSNRIVGFLVSSPKSGTISLTNFLASQTSISLLANIEPNYFKSSNHIALESNHTRPVAAKIKSADFYRVNKKMSKAPNERSKELPKKELLSEMGTLQAIVDLDISPWIIKINTL